MCGVWRGNEEQLEVSVKLQGDDLTGVTDTAHTTSMMPWKRRSTDLGLFRDLLGRISCWTLLKRKGVQVLVAFLGSLLQTQEQPIPVCRRSAGTSREPLPQGRQNQEACRSQEKQSDCLSMRGWGWESQSCGLKPPNHSSLTVLWFNPNRGTEWSLRCGVVSV